MSQTTTRHSGGKTADMRESINNQIQAWASSANWAEPDKADRLFKAVDRRPEDFISPNPTTCGSYREEASRCYDEIKETYNLRTESETSSGLSDYDEMRRQSAVRTLRDNFEAIESGNCSDLVEDIEAEYSEAFVREVLADERIEREIAESQSPTDETDETTEDTTETMSTKTESLGHESNGRTLGNVLIAAGERLNSGGSLRDMYRQGKSVAHEIYTMPIYLLVGWLVGLSIYVGLKSLVLTGRVIKLTIRALWVVVAGIPKGVVWSTDGLESWLVSQVTEGN